MREGRELVGPEFSRGAHEASGVELHAVFETLLVEVRDEVRNRQILALRDVEPQPPLPPPLPFPLPLPLPLPPLSLLSCLVKLSWPERAAC